MARDRGVGMSPAEIAELLDACHTVSLATVGPDGRPHLAAMWFAMHGADLLMWTYRSSQKARNVERDPRVGVLAEDGVDYGALRGVCLDCRVELVRDHAEVLEIGRALFRRNAPAAPGGPGADDAVLRAQAGKRIGMRLHVERARSWDHRKLGTPG